MGTKPTYPQLIRFQSRDKSTAYADLELAPGFVIRNVTYQDLAPRSEPLISTPTFFKDDFRLMTSPELSRFSEPPVVFSDSMRSWLRDQFEKKIAEKTMSREAKLDRRKERREGMEPPSGFESVVDFLTGLPGFSKDKPTEDEGA